LGKSVDHVKGEDEENEEPLKDSGDDDDSISGP